MPHGHLDGLLVSITSVSTLPLHHSVWRVARLEAKIRGEELKRAASEPIPAPVPDILEGLKASLARVEKPAATAGRSPAQRPAVN
jgi:hypothetical protein